MAEPCQGHCNSPGSAPNIQDMQRARVLGKKLLQVGKCEVEAQPSLGRFEIRRVLPCTTAETLDVGVGCHCYPNVTHAPSFEGLCRRFYFLKAELLIELIVRFAINFDIRIDEIIENWSILPGREHDVTPRGELH